MFIGFVMYGKNVVESVTLDAQADSEARDMLAKYVYSEYNDGGKSNGFTGILYDSTKMKTLKRSEV